MIRAVARRWLAGIAADLITSSATLGVAKPDPAFFPALVKLTGHSAGETAHVGDRVDLAVLPAAAAGLTAVLVRRGPWGVLHADRADAARAAIRVDSLAELPERLGSLRR